jgi:hypothetical protein
MRTKRVNGTTITDISPTVTAVTYGPDFPRSLSISDSDPNFLVACVTDGSDGGSNRIVAYTENAEGAATWTVLAGPGLIASMPYTECYAISKTAVYLMGKSALGFWAGSGTAIDSRIGNISTTAFCVGICGGPT